MSTITDDLLPTAADCNRKIAEAEAERASEYMHKRAEAAAEKEALLENLRKPSGVSDDARLKRVAAIIDRAVKNGQTEVFIGKFPNKLITDHGRAINQSEPGWENTLTGLPKELFAFWKRHMQPRGYRLRVEIVDWPNGMPGDIGSTLTWSGS